MKSRFSFVFLLFPFLLNLAFPGFSCLAVTGDEFLPHWEKLRAKVPSGKQSRAIFFIDFSIPSNEKRFFVVNAENGKILFSAPVAHGKGSGRGQFAEHFSDEPGKYASTLGLFRIGDSYEGKHGLSIRLKGMEKSNRNAEQRAVVIHKAWYCEPGFIRQYERCGNSWGCPALSPADFETALHWLKPGAYLYAYRSQNL